MWGGGGESGVEGRFEAPLVVLPMISPTRVLSRRTDDKKLTRRADERREAGGYSCHPCP